MERKLELLLDGTWVPFEMQNLDIDDVFRLFEPDGTPVDDGQMWIVLKLPYFSDGVWGAACEPIVGVISV